MKKCLFLIMLTMSMLFIFCSCGSNNSATNENQEAPAVIDTTDYNLVQTAMSNFVCENTYSIYDGWIYTMSFPEDGGYGLLAKMRTDGTEYTELTLIGAPYYINVDGEYIYMILVTEEGSTKAYRCRLGGNDLKKLTESNVWYLQLEGDYLYYNKFDNENSKTKGFYRCKKDGTEETLIFDKEIYYSYVIGDNIYYQDDKDGETIHRYNIETEEDEKITEGYSYSFVTDGECGYYIKNDKSTAERDYIGNLVKINISTKEETILYEGVSSAGILLKDDLIYFTNANDENRIYSIGKNGEGIRLVSQDTNCVRLASFDDYLLYTDFDENDEYIDGIYKCNLDGSDKIMINE